MKYIKFFEEYKGVFSLDIDIKEYVTKICLNMNISYDKIEVINSGLNGVAIDLGNTVLKITMDTTEVYFAEKLKNIKSENLVEIYDVKQINSKHQYGNLFAIHQEKLITNLNPTILHMIYYLHHKDSLYRKNEEEVYLYFKDKLLSLSKENILYLFNKFKSVYLECEKYNIPIDDFREKNMGVRNNEFVYFDVSDPYQSHKPNVEIINV